MKNKLKEFYAAGEQKIADRDLRLQRSAAKNRPQPRRLKISTEKNWVLIICVVSLAISLFTLISFVSYTYQMSELNRLQGEFNEKTIEFFNLINENEK